jgi:hypothetical protein
MKASLENIIQVDLCLTGFYLFLLSPVSSQVVSDLGHITMVQGHEMVTVTRSEPISNHPHGYERLRNDIDVTLSITRSHVRKYLLLSVYHSRRKFCQW